MGKTSAEATPIEQSNPWSADVLTASSPPDQGWANFESSPFLANFGYELSSTIATSASDDMDRVPFDLTPTEASSMPFPLDESNSPPDDWPSETADVNKNLTNDIFQAMESAQVTTSEHSAEIIAASDIIIKTRPDASLSSCLPSSPAKPVMAAFTPETVIEQTDHFDNSALPLTNPSDDDVAKQLSDLLAEVSVAVGEDVLVNSSESRTLCDGKEDSTNGPDDTANTHRNTSPVSNNSM